MPPVKYNKLKSLAVYIWSYFTVKVDRYSKRYTIHANLTDIVHNALSFVLASPEARENKFE